MKNSLKLIESSSENKVSLVLIYSMYDIFGQIKLSYYDYYIVVCGYSYYLGIRYTFLLPEIRENTHRSSNVILGIIWDRWVKFTSMLSQDLALTEAAFTL
jgi:hypothetical protein